MNNPFFGKKIFISGADGFIGSHLAEDLVKKGANVKALVYYNSWNQKGWISDIKPEISSEIEIVYGDIRDSELIKKIVNGQEYVFHLSSLIAIPHSYDAPRSYIETNISGALNVLEACRNNDSLVRLIHVSTSEVYGSAQTVPISEKHPLVAQSPYSASKISADKIAESYFLSFGIPVVIARPFNTFGPRQTSRAVIPTIASQLIAGSKKLKLGLLTPTRDFNYVLDTIRGMEQLATCYKAEGEVVNIGSGIEWSIAQTVEILCEIIGAKVEISKEENRIRPSKSEVNRLLADNKKITNLTGWSNETSFKEGLKMTVDWIKQNIEKFDIDSYSK